MFYKILFLEILLCCSLVGLRIKQAYGTSEDGSVHTPARKERGDPKLRFPVRGHTMSDVISDFGDPRGGRTHQGIDIKAPRGTKVVAVTDGFIERVKEGPRAGKSIYLRDGEGRLYFYAHLDEWETEEFAPVEAGEIIGRVGNSGNASGTTPHLHFEVLLGKDRTAQDPANFWEAN